LQLREDNADLRLTAAGRRLGLVDDARWEAFSRKCEIVSRETARLTTTRVTAQGDSGPQTRSLLELLRRPGATYDSVVALAETPRVSRETLQGEAGRRLADQAIEQIETSARYSGYVEKQRAEVERSARAESTKIPDGLDFQAIPALSFEARQTLTTHRPATIGAASRLAGMTPAALSLLLVHVKKHNRPEAAGHARKPFGTTA
jgi:tRNA uridine 5-carboxymethylaminomethyl modification enzyme